MKTKFKNIIKKLRYQYLNWLSFIRYKIVLKIMGKYSLTYHMARELPITEEDAIKIISFISCGAGDNLINYIAQREYKRSLLARRN